MTQWVGWSPDLDRWEEAGGFLELISRLMAGARLKELFRDPQVSFVTGAPGERFYRKGWRFDP